MSKSSGAKLEIKKTNKENKESKVQQTPLKSVVEQKSKEKDKNNKKVKNDQAQVVQEKDKTSKKKDKKGKDEQKKDGKVQKSADKKNKKEKKQQKEDKKSKKDKKDQKDQKKDKQQLQQSSLNKSQSKSNSLSKLKSDRQLEAINNIHNTQNKAKMTIQQLIEQYKSQAERLLFHNHGYDPQKQKQIQKSLQQLQKQKEKRHQKLQNLKQKRQQLQKSRQKVKQTKMQLRKQKIREKKVKHAEEKVSAIGISAEQRRREYQKFLQYVKERKKFKPRFKRYEQQYQQYLRQEQQDYRDKLDELNRKYGPMNVNQLTSFEQNYLSQKQEGLHYRQNKIKLEQELIKQQNDRRQKLIWKGLCHRNVVEQEKERLKKKKQPWQKLSTIKQYGKVVAQNLKKQKQEVPQDQKQKQNDQLYDENKQKIAYHQKYVQGVNYGLVPYQKQSPLSLEQKNQKGNKYLQQLRQINKNRKNKTVDYSNINSSRRYSENQDLKKDKRTFRTRRKSNPYYSIQQNKNEMQFKDYQSIQFSLQKLNLIKKDRQLNDQIVKHGQYASILDIQERKKRAGSLVVKQISQKLNVLSKL